MRGLIGLCYRLVIGVSRRQVVRRSRLMGARLFSMLIAVNSGVCGLLLLIFDPITTLLLCRSSWFTKGQILRNPQGTCEPTGALRYVLATKVCYDLIFVFRTFIASSVRRFGYSHFGSRDLIVA